MKTIIKQTYEMGIKEFFTLYDNPIQRDTLKQVKKGMTSKEGHLKEFHSRHENIDIAVDTSTGKTYLLDGHCRRYIWKNNLYGYIPPTVHGDKYFVSSINEVKDLYKTYDTDDAVESTRDMLFGALQDNGLTAKSSLLLVGGG